MTPTAVLSAVPDDVLRAGGNLMNGPRKNRKRIGELERENAKLREELHDQWWMNHSEHCGDEWPHAAGERCHWPLPDVLGGAGGSQ